MLMLDLATVLTVSAVPVPRQSACGPPLMVQLDKARVREALYSTAAKSAYGAKRFILFRGAAPNKLASTL